MSAAVASPAPAKLRLGDIDVEAQKAIMADIERRKAADRRGRECERRQDQTPGTARRDSETSGGVLPKPGAARKGKGGKAPGSSAKKRAATASGPDRRWTGGVEAQAKTAEAVAAQKPEGGSDGHQVFSVDDGESAEACCPMDIRDFFSKRG